MHARFSAARLRLFDFLADSTHPDSPTLIGGRTQLLRNLKSQTLRKSDEIAALPKDVAAEIAAVQVG